MRNRLALVAQRIEHLTTDQKVRGSNPFGRTIKLFYSGKVIVKINIVCKLLLTIKYEIL
jgi:hypothetical protein